MNKLSKPRLIAGWILILAVVAMLGMAGAGKFFGSAPPEVVAAMTKAGIAERMQLIGAGALLTSVLLLIPQTASLGVLLASAYWGGAILMHFVLGDSFTTPAVLLVMTWAGCALRGPWLLGSFQGQKCTAQCQA